MSRPVVVVAYCRDFLTAFPGPSAAALDTALRRAGWSVTAHHAPDGTFPDGELCVDLPEDPAGRTVVICQSVTGADTPSDLSLMSLLATARCYREHGAARIVALLPHLAYARHDRRVPGERRPVMAGLLADLSAAAGLDAVFSLASGAEDLLQELFARTRTRLVFLPADEIRIGLLRPLLRDGSVLVAPDAGAAGQVGALAAGLELPLLVAEKRRTGPEEVTVALGTPPGAGPVRHAVVVDDLITSAATVEQVAAALRARDPDVVIDVVATHLRLTAPGTRRLERLLGTGVLRAVRTTDAAGHRPDLPGLAVSPAMPWLATALTHRLGTAAPAAARQPERQPPVPGRQTERQPPAPPAGPERKPLHDTHR
ncbi:ribose-phosphate pyrophosphokinase-like domain-containing protein [Streptomyces sp. NRRL F-5727]|uniref:ribose-phosphate pyrophosphokinase-like domain-containing protein n=1 Tax=Streptomyces sp. NRRL F-5727 TaxID=1463871 RepID=UPI00068EFC62|nr:ribose-phosphate pyrophosphokinase-like domain-containing protein [Streptomyces sp. NRRL F-5727]